MVLNYNSEMEKVLKMLGNSKSMVLATSSQGHTTARMVSCIIYDNKIVFQTSSDTVKYKQLVENPQVALCFDPISLEGISKVVGHPFLESNKAIAELYEKYCKGSFDTYSYMRTNAFIEVSITFITIWGYDNGEPYRTLIDTQLKLAIKEMYDYSDRILRDK